MRADLLERFFSDKVQRRPSLPRGESSQPSARGRGTGRDGQAQVLPLGLQRRMHSYYSHIHIQSVKLQRASFSHQSNTCRVNHLRELFEDESENVLNHLSVFSNLMHLEVQRFRVAV